MEGLVQGSVLSSLVQELPRWVGKADTPEGLIRLSLREDQLWVETASVVMAGLWHVPATITKPGSVVVSGSSFISWLSRIGEGAVQLKVTENRRLTLRIGRKSGWIAVQDHPETFWEFPTDINEVGRCPATLPWKKVVPLVGWAVASGGVSVTNPVLHHVALQRDADNHWVWLASNGQVLVRWVWNTVDFVGTTPRILPWEFVQAAFPLFEHQVVTVYWGPQVGVWETPEGRWTHRWVEGQYPNSDRFFSRDFAIQGTTDTTETTEALWAVKDLVQPDQGVTLTWEDQQLTWAVHRPHADASVQISCTGNLTGSVHLGLSVLGGLVKAALGPTLTWGLDSSGSFGVYRWFYEADPLWQVVGMPLLTE